VPRFDQSSRTDREQSYLAQLEGHMDLCVVCGAREAIRKVEDKS
jgi:hypothetical protein